MNILLVDDSKTMRSIQKTALMALGDVTFAEAGDGIEAQTVLNAAPIGAFHLIIVDWNMPNMDGLTLVGCIREKDKHTPIIMVTTETEKPRVMAAIERGVNNYVVKPFRPEMLVDKVRQTLARMKKAA